MTEPRSRAWAGLALLWLLAVAGLAWQQTGFWQAARLDSDVLALLPGAAEDGRVALANQRLAQGSTRQIVVLLGHDDWAPLQRGAKAFASRLQDEPRLQALPPDAAVGDAMAAYAPYQRGLLTRDQRQRLLDEEPQALASLALARLFAPGAAPDWAADPLGLELGWWQARAGRGPAPREGLLALDSPVGPWVVQRFEQRGSPFALDGDRHLQAALDRAFADAQAAAGRPLRRLQAGVPLHAEAAAARASQEVATIGLGSLLAVLLLVWLAFRSLRPILLVALSLLVGVAAGVAATAWVFGQVHLLTLVFGASLVGVAEDYGIHYFASRQQDGAAPRPLMRRLLPALALALATSVVAYLTLAIAPFPGLRQMAVFSAAGLAAAFLTVVLWFPFLDRASPRPSRFSRWVAGSLARWLRWPRGVAGIAIGLALATVVGVGLLQLQVRDDLRSLQASPPELLASEREAAALLSLPSPAQYFLVEAGDPQALLRAEESLVDALHELRASGTLAGWRAVSDYLPSQSRQQADAGLRRTAEAAILAQASAVLGESLVAAPEPDAWLGPDTWLAAPASAPLRPLWLGEQGGPGWASVVLLEGLTPDSTAALARLAESRPQVRWIDRTASYSALLSHYRQMMGWLVLVAYVAVGLALVLRFGRAAWRALLPTALAATITLGLLGWLGVPLDLFGVLAQLLLLGFGIDYGIFLLEHDGDPASWLAVCLGAASTSLAFGLLALSATPALHSFGLSLLLGISLVWLLSPCFRPRREIGALAR
ncbi:MMPL family transporter [Arenimonas donghaensis]|uniref:Membrane transport protein MMPL domain-containing protein n=1 Tax=Arenimonas donghaensis DSM 18148 = HO3-R19 TaxID=1121014 RepID=A0A087MLU5_9GAMM|nr:MMPL family transporter [Arenimonas donghaensis]KFL37848.1 hypothetical protein N788_01385 [Arenimonas donghaensis DSM 18148 = HO3-R19]